MKESPHITLSEEQDKRETVICIVYASVVVFGMLALMLHGMAFLSWTEVTNEDIYARKHMAEDIEILQNEILRYGELIESIESYDVPRLENHKHQFWSGKIKKEVIR